MGIKVSKTYKVLCKECKNIYSRKKVVNILYSDKPEDNGSFFCKKCFIRKIPYYVEGRI